MITGSGALSMIARGAAPSHPRSIRPRTFRRTQTVAVAIYDAVEAGNASLARTLVVVVSLTAIVILTLANRVGRRAAA